MVGGHAGRGRTFGCRVLTTQVLDVGKMIEPFTERAGERLDNAKIGCSAQMGKLCADA